MTRLALFTLATLLGFNATASRAQQISPNTSPPPPPALPPAPTEPAFDPFHAAKSIEIGTFYLKKGRLDAAIDRFQEASKYEPGLAEPWRLLGQAYERKRDYRDALDAYDKYLAILPGAPDAPKIKKRIAGLQQKIASAASKH